MTPKEKAEELIKRFNKVEIYIDIEPSNIETDIGNVDCDASKQCALIAVDETMAYAKSHGFVGLVEYYQEVKQEIKKL